MKLTRLPPFFPSFPLPPPPAQEGIEEDSGRRAAAVDLRTAGERDACTTDDFLQAHYYCGEAVTGMRCCKLAPSGDKLILTSTVTGALLALVPLPTKEQIAFFQTLERALEVYQEEQGVSVLGVEGQGGGGGAPGLSLCFRDHCSYRSTFRPAKNTVDGDACERLMSWPPEAQARVAELVGREWHEIRNRVERVRKVALLG